MSTIRDTHMYEFAFGDDLVIVDTDWCGYQYVTVNGRVVVDCGGDCRPLFDVIETPLNQQAKDFARECLENYNAVRDVWEAREEEEEWTPWAP